jgi:hypothetical protein
MLLYDTKKQSIILKFSPMIDEKKQKILFSSRLGSTKKLTFIPRPFPKFQSLNKRISSVNQDLLSCTLPHWMQGALFQKT